MLILRGGLRKKTNISWKNVHLHGVIHWVENPLPVIVANEGLGWDSLLKMVHNPGGDSYWEGGQPKLYTH